MADDSTNLMKFHECQDGQAQATRLNESVNNGKACEPQNMQRERELGDAIKDTGANQAGNINDAKNHSGGTGGNSSSSNNNTYLYSNHSLI